ncbi:MAG: flavin-containing monooxygenase [Acidimicrobiales bacterium]
MATSTAVEHVRVVVVGTGFSGLAAAYRLKERFGERGNDFVVLEKADEVGGTWRDNVYPGCRCDVPSHLYSFSFAPNPDWSELFSPQPEIRQYLNDVVDRFGLRRSIRFGTALEDAAWDDDLQRWVLRTSAGPLTCDLLVAGTGPFDEPSYPDIEGLASFDGLVMHSARWDHDVDLGDKRVAVIGTGASAVQFVPHVQKQAAQLHLFQRTPAWVLPHINRRMTRLEKRLFRRLPLAQKGLRFGIYAGTETVSVALTRWPILTNFIRLGALLFLRTQVRDRDKRRKLTPNYRPGCKRLLPSEGFYAAVDKPNVGVVTDGITAVDGSCVVTADGRRREVDVIICGTGFKVVDNPYAEAVRGRDGVTLAKAWAADGVQAHLGTTVPGFPNLFILAGPNTGIGHTSLVVMIESQVRYLLGCLDELDRRRASTVEVRRGPFEAYNAELQERMKRTVWTTGGCKSWYLDDKGRNPTLWPDFTFRFVQKTWRFDAENYDFGSAVAAS